MRLVAGSQLGPYEVLALIGAGGSGEVWTARDNRTNGVVAIKQIQSAHMARFSLEADAISKLRHPNICSLFDIGPDYLVMEYVEGPTLRGPIAPDKAARLGLQIASAIEAAHERGILHGDLKPGNVIVTHGSPKLLDFGLARTRSNDNRHPASATVGAATMGVAYLSPEHAQGKPLEVRSDVFSFGTLLYEMLSGHRAFTGGSSADVLAAIVGGEPKAFAMPEPLSGVVSLCLRKNPAERFQRMGDVRAALEQSIG